MTEKAIVDENHISSVMPQESIAPANPTDVVI